MVVVIKAVLAEVGDIDIRPAVIVVVGDGDADTPAIIGHACLRRYIGKGAIVIVVKERSMGRSCFTVYSVVGRAIDEIDIQPAVVVIVDKADARSICLDDEFLLRGAHHVSPHCQTRFLGDVLKDDGSVLDEAAGSDGSVLAVEDCWVSAASICSSRG